MKKSTIYKKYTIKELIDLIQKEGRELPPSGNKKELVNMYSDILMEKTVSDVENTLVSKSGSNAMNDLTEDDKVVKDPLDIIFDEGILFRIDSHCWWGKSTRVREKEINAPKNIISGVKTLIDDRKISVMKSLRSYGERIVKSRSYPFLGLRGVYYVPKSFIGEIEEELKKVQQQFYDRRTKFLENYELYKLQWKKKSGKYYDESLYPSPAALKRRFSFNWTKFIITLPDSNMKILTDKEIMEETEKQRANARRFMDESVTVLAGKFIALLQNLQTRLEKGETMRPKSVNALKNFLASFDKWNFTDNQSLSNMVQDSKKILGNINTSDLNNDQKLANKIQEQTDSIIKAFEKVSKTDTRFSRALDF